jgi:hypothetical protein
MKKLQQNAWKLRDDPETAAKLKYLDTVRVEDGKLIITTNANR